MKTDSRPMNEVYHQVINEYDSNFDYGVIIQKRYENCLVLLKKNDIFSSNEFLQKNHELIGIRKNISPASAKIILNVSLKIGRELGLLKVVDTKHPISYVDFYNLETVSYFAKQLRGSKLQNLRDSNSWKHSTRGNYLYRLWTFNNWLHGKAFEFSKIHYIDNDTFRKERTATKLEGVEHFLKLYQDSIPGWVKNNAEWWANGQVSDNEFVNAIQFLVKEGIIRV